MSSIEIKIHVVTPVRNEEEYLPGLADSILTQRERPFRWTIFDDGSKDRTPSIIEQLEEQYDWIKSIRVKDRGCRARGHGNTVALKMGFEQALRHSWVEVLGALDAALLIKHHRPVGAADGFAKDQLKAGRDAYFIGSDPVLVLARGLRKMIKTKPYFVGGLIFPSAYFGNKFLATERYPDPKLLGYVKKRHREILLQGFYKW